MECDAPTPLPNRPVTFSKKMRTGLTIWLWDSTLQMLYFLFSPSSPSSPSSVWLCLIDSHPYTFCFVHKSHKKHNWKWSRRTKEEWLLTFEGTIVLSRIFNFLYNNFYMCYYWNRGFSDMIYRPSHGHFLLNGKLQESTSVINRTGRNVSSWEIPFQSKIRHRKPHIQHIDTSWKSNYSHFVSTYRSR